MTLFYLARPFSSCLLTRAVWTRLYVLRFDEAFLCGYIMDSIFFAQMKRGLRSFDVIEALLISLPVFAVIRALLKTSRALT